MSARYKPQPGCDDTLAEKVLPALLLAASAVLFVAGRILERVGGRR